MILYRYRPHYTLRDRIWANSCVTASIVMLD